MIKALRRKKSLPHIKWCLLLIFQLLPLLQLHGQFRPGGTNQKSLDLRPASSNPYDFGSTVDEILQDASDTSSYDPLTVMQLRMLKEDAQPSWNPEDIDPYKTRRAVEKALAIELGSHLSRQLMKSELRDTYRNTLRAYKRLQDRFRYSLQSDGESMALSRKNEGRKLLELNVEFNLKRGVDPQIRIGDAVRFRYDYLYERTMLEFGFNF